MNNNILLNNKFNTWFIDQTGAYIGAFNNTENLVFKFNENMCNTFANCNNMVMNLTFYNNMFTEVSNIYGAFYNCQNIIGSPICPPKVTSLQNTYYNCQNLTGSPVCTDNVTVMYYAYYMCKNLTGNPVCGNNVTSFAYAYYGCSNLTGPPVFGPEVTSAQYAYSSANLYNQDPVFSKNVQYMDGTYSATHLRRPLMPDWFNGRCSDLYASANFASPQPAACGNAITHAANMYRGAKNITVAAAGLNLQSMWQMYASSSVIVPACGPNVTNMDDTYSNCKNLIGPAVCGDNVTTMRSTYLSCLNLTGPAAIGPKVTDAYWTYTSTNINIAACSDQLTALSNTYLYCQSLYAAACGFNVTNMTNSYNFCYSLRHPACGPNVSNMADCYNRCYGVREIVIGPNVRFANQAYNSALNYFYNSSNLNVVLPPNLTHARSLFQCPYQASNTPGGNIYFYGPDYQYNIFNLFGGSRDNARILNVHVIAGSNTYTNLKGSYTWEVNTELGCEVCNNVRLYNHENIFSDIGDYKYFYRHPSGNIYKYSYNGVSWNNNQATDCNISLSAGNYIQSIKGENKWFINEPTTVSAAVSPNPNDYFYLEPADGVASSTFKLSRSAAYVEMTEPTFEYSTDKVNWSTYTLDTEITISTGSKLYLRGDNSRGLVDHSYNNVWAKNGYIKIISSANFKVGGNFSSLVANSPYLGTIEIPGAYCFAMLFYQNTKLVDASKLNCDVDGEFCYYSTFEQCSLLTSLPRFVLRTVSASLAESAFRLCNNLTTIPTGMLPAKTVSKHCYRNMFSECRNLNNVPIGLLPATKLAQSCYQAMFTNCTNLIKPPALPATEVEYTSYSEMFYNCRNMTYMPYLPAQSNIQNCVHAYYAMFGNCNNLGIYSSQTAEHNYPVSLNLTGSVNMFYLTKGDYAYSSSITLPTTIYTINEPITYVDDSEYKFDGWYNGGTKVSSDIDYTFTPTGDVTLEARGIAS